MNLSKGIIKPSDAIKEELLQWVSSLEDGQVLDLLNSIKNSAQGKEHDWWNDLSDSEKENVEAGIAEEAQGQVLSSSDFWHALRVDG